MNYLYNGAELPALPKLSHPYAFITRILNYYTLYTTETTEHGYNSSNNWSLTAIPSHTLNEQKWKNIDNAAETNPSIVYVIWANFDIIAEDGTLYLAASEPVPVYPTVPKVSPQLAFTIGKQLGRRIFHGSVSAESS